MPSLSYRALSALFALALAGCATIPTDRGFGDVQIQTALRGVPVPDPASAGTQQRLVQSILGEPLSEADAVRLAFINNPRLQSEYARLGFSGADVIQAGALSNPALTASGQHASLAGAANRYDLGLTQNLAELILLPARTRFSKAEFERAKLETTGSLLDLAASVQYAYYNAVGARQIADMRTMIATAASVSADLSERYKAAGSESALGLAVDQAARSQATLDAEYTQAQAHLAERSLNTLMGLDADASWVLETKLPAPVATEDTLESLQKLADQCRPDLDSDRRAVVLLEDALGLTRSYRFLGEVNVGAQFERDTDRNRLIGPSLSIELPVFNQGQAAILKAQSLLEAAQAQQRATELDVSNRVRATFERLIAIRARINRLRAETIPLRQAVVARTQEEVNYMLVGVFDLLRAKQAEYAAYEQYLDAVCDYWKTRSDLSRAIGTALPSDRLIGAPSVGPRAAAEPDRSASRAPMRTDRSDASAPGMEPRAMDPPSAAARQAAANAGAPSTADRGDDR